MVFGTTKWAFFEDHKKWFQIAATFPDLLVAGRPAGSIWTSGGSPSWTSKLKDFNGV